MRTFAWVVILGRNGLINQGLIQLGVVDRPVALIYNMMGVQIGSSSAEKPNCRNCL